MNLKVTFIDFLTTLTINGVTTIKEEGSYLNFYNDGSAIPSAAVRTVQVAYWQKI